MVAEIKDLYCNSHTCHSGFVPRGPPLSVQVQAVSGQAISLRSGRSRSRPRYSATQRLTGKLSSTVPVTFSSRPGSDGHHGVDSVQ